MRVDIHSAPLGTSSSGRGFPGIAGDLHGPAARDACAHPWSAVPAAARFPREIVRQIRHEIEIETSAERVWEVLSDFASYPDWNPFICRITGDLGEGSRLEARIRPPGRRGMTFRPTVVGAVARRELSWVGSLLGPRLVDGRHSFTVEPLDEERVRFVQRAVLSGLLVPFCARALEDAERGFEEMNHALKTRAEGVSLQGGAAVTVRSIIVGYDGSESARRALERAAEFASDEATVGVVHAAPPLYSGPRTGRVVDPSDEQEQERLLAEGRAHLAARGIAAITIPAEGDPAKALVSIAWHDDVDLIVVGTPGHRLAGALLGSVSSKVIHDAPCDVLVVR
jgi:nucleotide-binding universal stress UspA family protein